MLPEGPTSYLSPLEDILNQRIVTLTLNLSRSSKVKPMGPTSQLLPFLTYFTSKSMTLIFDPQLIQGQIWRCQSKARVSWGPISYLSPFSRYFEILQSAVTKTHVMLRLFFIVECGTCIARFFWAMRVLEVRASSSTHRLRLCQILFLSRPPLLS